MSVILETTLGDLVVDLFIDERPRACQNFLKLCKVKYYNFCLFFSIQRDFIAQTGDPSGSGKGGESVYKMLYGDKARYFDMELKPRIKHKKRGMVSFANNGKNMHGSQFFITLEEDLDYLDGKHTIFGEVAEGFDILDKLNETICDDDNRPYQDIRLNHTIIIDDPFDDPDGLPIPDKSPLPTKEQLDSGRIGADEEVDDTKGKSIVEIQKQIEEKELRIDTQILETIGDIPDADMKPPENVLFVCKLNPVTSAEDLGIIFSRFGHILSHEILRDNKTGDSLCYGFIEFEKVEECEKAYLKMDNVLIDDRRIHVDFCQSVAKVKWKTSGVFQRQAKQNNTQSTQKYLVKEKERKDNRYKMVFSDDGGSSDGHNSKRSESKIEKKSKKRKKKNDKEISESDDEHRHKKKRNKEQLRRDPGSPPLLKSRSRSPADSRKSHKTKREHKIRGKDRSSSVSDDTPVPEKRKETKKNYSNNEGRDHKRKEEVEVSKKYSNLNQQMKDASSSNSDNYFVPEKIKGVKKHDGDHVEHKRKEAERRNKHTVKELRDVHERHDKDKKRHKKRPRSRSGSVERKRKYRSDVDSSG